MLKAFRGVEVEHRQILSRFTRLNTVENVLSGLILQARPGYIPMDTTIRLTTDDTDTAQCSQHHYMGTYFRIVS